MTTTFNIGTSTSELFIIFGTFVNVLFFVCVLSYNLKYEYVLLSLCSQDSNVNWTSVRQLSDWIFSDNILLTIQYMGCRLEHNCTSCQKFFLELDWVFFFFIIVGLEILLLFLKGRYGIISEVQDWNPVHWHRMKAYYGSY